MPVIDLSQIVIATKATVCTSKCSALCKSKRNYHANRPWLLSLFMSPSSLQAKIRDSKTTIWDCDEPALPFRVQVPVGICSVQSSHYTIPVQRAVSDIADSAEGTCVFHVAEMLPFFRMNTILGQNQKLALSGKDIWDADEGAFVRLNICVILWCTHKDKTDSSNWQMLNELLNDSQGQPCFNPAKPLN